MNKAHKTLILENWFAMDYILFGKRSTKAIVKEDNLKEFLTNKGSLFSNLAEIYNAIDYKSNNKYSNLKELQIKSKEKAERSLEEAKKIIKSKSVNSIIKEEISKAGITEGLTEEEIAQYVISKKLKEIAIDYLLFEGLDQDKEAKKKLKDWKGNVYIQSHNLLRTDAINAAL